jgi:hypothetical protein
VAWDHVARYNENPTGENTFQVLISDGTNPDMGLGNNICFCYEDMEWTYPGGFGGTQATVGANRGNGADFLQIGRYNTQAGLNADLVDKAYCFGSDTGTNGDPHCEYISMCANAFQ